MAEVKRNEETGAIESITVRDFAGYGATIYPPNPSTGRIRITTANRGGIGAPVDLEPSEARKLAHDLADLAGEGD